MNALLIALLLATQPAEWRQFRGDGSSTAPDAIGGGALRVSWSAPLPGPGPSSPIVSAGRVFVSAANGREQSRLMVAAFDLESGMKLWQRGLAATGSTVFNPFGGIAAATPATDGSSVVALFSSNDLACFDLDGSLRWYRGLGLENPTTRNDVGMASSPLLVGSAVVVQLENQGASFAAGLDLATGVTRWRIERPQAATWTSPVAMQAGAGQSLVLLQSKPYLSAVDPASGRLVWQFEAPCHTVASLTVSRKRIFLPANGMQTLETDGAEVRTGWFDNRLQCGNCSPIVAGGRLYVLKGSGVLACADLENGKTLWQLRLKGPFWATPVVAGQRLYAVNQAGQVQVVALGNEGKLLQTIETESGMLGSPAVAGQSLVLRGPTKLWKLTASENPSK